MGRGNNLLYGGAFPVIKKGSPTTTVLSFSFPADPEKIALHNRGYFLVTREDQLYSVNISENGEETVFQVPVDGFSSSKASLNSSGALWFEGEDIYYRSLFPDMSFDKQKLPRAGRSDEFPIALHLASGNGAYLIEEEEDKEGKMRANFKVFRIDPSAAEAEGFWRDYFAETKWFRIDSFQPAPDSGWLFYKGLSDAGKKIQEVHLFSAGEKTKQWKFSDLEEDFYYHSPQLLFHQKSGEAIYSFNDKLYGLKLASKKGDRRMISHFPEPIKDFSLRDDRLAVILEGGDLYHYHLLSGQMKKEASLDFPAQEVLFSGDDLLVLSSGREYLYLPQFS